MFEEKTVNAADIPNTIGEAEVRRAMEILKKYKAGKKNLEDRVIDDEQFWKMRHWEQMRTGNPHDPKPASGWLLNVVLNKHADLMDNYPEPNCLPRAEDDKEEAKKLSKILPVVLEQNDFLYTYNVNSLKKVKSGTGIYGVFWDTSKLNGLGDIKITSIDSLNIFWEPGVEDIQDSENVFSVDLVNKSKLIAKYPQLAERLKSGDNVGISKYIYDDAVDTSEKALVVDWYYKKNGILHFVKFVEDVVLYATENDTQVPTKPAPALDENGNAMVIEQPVGKSMAESGLYDHGKYPFIFDVQFKEEGTPCGYGYIDICKDAQIQIDAMNQAMLKNTLLNSTPRFFVRNDGSVNEMEYADWTKPFVHTDGNLGEDSINPINTPMLSPVYVTFLQNKIQELRETSGNTESATGVSSSSVTAASAIAALQEASGKLSRTSSKISWRAFKEVCLICIELIRQFYDMPRTFRITGEYGVEEFTTFDNSGLLPQYQGTAFGEDMGYRTPVFDIDVVPQNESKYTKAEYNQLALEFYSAGMFNPQMSDQALTALSMMDFKGKETLEQKISQNGTMFQQIIMMQQQMLKMAQIIDSQNGTNMAEQIAMGVTGNSQPIPGGNIKPEVSEQMGGSGQAITEKARARTQQSTEPR